MSKYYTYKKSIFNCEKCNWEGFGEQANVGEYFNWNCFDIVCPQCHESIAVIDFPTFEEVFEYGTEGKKANTMEQKHFHERVKKSRLNNAGQLPEIDAERIVIKLCEEEATDDADSFIVLYWNNEEIWREIRTYEYFDRYIELGNILKEKYGARLIDFEAKHTTYFGGDDLSSIGVIERFRDSLSKN